MAATPECRVCGSETSKAGTKAGWRHVVYALAFCDECGYSFVVDPPSDFDVLYGEDYYRGEGADPTVNYLREMTDPLTVRHYEWSGVARIVEAMTGSVDGLRWLDYGCGLGGLVRHARSLGSDAWGFEEGYAADWMATNNVPMKTRSDLASEGASYSVVTAIEVIEHVPDPIPFLEEVAACLAPGGVLFLTTGNAEPQRGKISSWQYCKPDVHVSYFEPRTLDVALRRAGLEPQHVGWLPGFSDVVRYKILKTLGVARTNVLERMVPWRMLSRAVDRRYGVSAQPIGRKPEEI